MECQLTRTTVNKVGTTRKTVQKIKVAVQKSERRRNVPDNHVYDPSIPRPPHRLNEHTGSRGNQAWHDQQNKGGFQMGDRDAGFQMGNASNPYIMGGNRSVASRSPAHLRRDRRKRGKSSLPFEV